MFEEIIAVIAYVRSRKQKLKKKQKLWVHPFVDDCPTSGIFCKIYSDLRKYPDKFFSYLCLSIGSFYELLIICENDLTKRDTILRKSISPEQKLFVTLGRQWTGRRNAEGLKNTHLDYIASSGSVNDELELFLEGSSDGLVKEVYRH
jgi:hypothetical protein